MTLVESSTVVSSFSSSERYGTSRLVQEYRPRSAKDTVLHQVVVEYLETFLEEARARGEGVPKFVERAFRKFIECGCLARGFARIRCAECGFERLLPFSCKTRGLCASCSGRRMTELSAHLVDSVIPVVPVRQWVLTLPHALRYKLAWNHEQLRAVLSTFTGALEDFYRDEAVERGVRGGRTGFVTAIQRVGSALNLNPHFHTLGLDGVFVRDPDGSLAFHPVGPLTDEEVAALSAEVRNRIVELLTELGLFEENDASFHFDELSEASPTLAGIYSASVRGRVSMGQRAGRKVMKIGADPNAPWVTSRAPLQAHLDGFDLHAGVTVASSYPSDRDRLERLCRYVLRPPVVQDRLEELEDGNVLLELKTPFWDGTSHVLFEPLELLEKVAALIPRPRVNQLIYHGVLAPNAKWRREVVSYGREAEALDEERLSSCDGHEDDTIPSGADEPQRRRRSYTWAELMKRAFPIDVLECPRCSGRMRLISMIEDPRIIKKILDHLGFPTEVPSASPSSSSRQSNLEEIVYEMDVF